MRRLWRSGLSLPVMPPPPPQPLLLCCAIVQGTRCADSPCSCSFDTNDALYDLAWSEINENQLVVACGDGSLKLFDLGVNDFPVMSFHEHKREAFSVSWNPVTKDNFISSSWDGTVKIVR